MSEQQEVSAAIAEYSPVAAGLADLRHRFKDLVFDVTTRAGDKEARAARMELVSLRTSLEDKRKALKAPALERARLIDSEAKRIEQEIRALEGPIDQAIKSEEARRETERRQREEQERAEREALQAKINAIREISFSAVGKGSVVIGTMIEDLNEMAIDNSFGERMQEAKDLQAATLRTLEALFKDAQASEEEARRLRQERADFEVLQAKLAAEQAEKDRQERERKEAEEAALREKRRLEDEERAAAARKHEAEMAAQREALARSQAEIERRDAELKAEEDRRAAELKAEETRRREQEEKQAAAEREAFEQEALARKQEEEAAAKEREAAIEQEAKKEAEKSVPPVSAADNSIEAVALCCDIALMPNKRPTLAAWQALLVRANRIREVALFSKVD